MFRWLCTAYNVSGGARLLRGVVAGGGRQLRTPPQLRDQLAAARGAAARYPHDLSVHSASQHLIADQHSTCAASESYWAMVSRLSWQQSWSLMQMSGSLQQQTYIVELLSTCISMFV